MDNRNRPPRESKTLFLPLFLCLGLLTILAGCNTDYEDALGEGFPDPPAIEFRKTASFNGIPVIELQFLQTFKRDENGNLTSSQLEVVARNLGNLEIPGNSLRYEVVVYDSNLRNAEDIRLKASVTLTDTLKARDTTARTTFVENFFDAVLDPDKVEIRLLKYPDGLGFSGAYEGMYRAYRLDSVDPPVFERRTIVHQQPFQLSLAADGLCTGWIAGENPVKKLTGSISAQDSLFLGNALRLDGAALYQLSRCDTCTIEATEQILRMELGVADSAQANGVQVLELDLFSTNKKN